jgi:hypothetical protein
MVILGGERRHSGGQKVNLKRTCASLIGIAKEIGRE